MGQQYSFVVKVLHDHALVLKDLAILNHGGLASKYFVMSFILIVLVSRVFN